MSSVPIVRGDSLCDSAFTSGSWRNSVSGAVIRSPGQCCVMRFLAGTLSTILFGSQWVTAQATGHSEISIPRLQNRPFQANYVIRTGGTQTTGRIYRDSHARVRRDTRIYVGAVATTVVLTLISDPVARVTIILNPSTKVAKKAPRPSWGAPPAMVTEPSIPSGWDIQDLGEKTVAGVVCHGYGATVGGQLVEWWSSPYLGMTVRSGPAGKPSSELTDIQLGEPDPGLFVVPPDYSLDQ